MHEICHILHRHVYHLVASHQPTVLQIKMVSDRCTHAISFSMASRRLVCVCAVALCSTQYTFLLLFNYILCIIYSWAIYCQKIVLIVAWAPPTERIKCIVNPLKLCLVHKRLQSEAFFNAFDSWVYIIFFCLHLVSCKISILTFRFAFVIGSVGKHLGYQQINTNTHTCKLIAFGNIYVRRRPHIKSSTLCE